MSVLQYFQEKTEAWVSLLTSAGTTWGTDELWVLDARRFFSGSRREGGLVPAEESVRLFDRPSLTLHGSVLGTLCYILM